MGNVVAANAQAALPFDCPIEGAIQGERRLMAYPFFALEKGGKQTEIVHELRGAKITIRAGKTGMATMWDKKILLYAATLLLKKSKKGQEVSQDVVFTAHDFFLAVGQEKVGKRNYERFAEALSRLQGTQIQTDVKTGGQIHRGWFSWLESAEAVYHEGPEGIERLRAVKVRLCAFLFQAIMREAQIYDYHPEYFQLPPTEQRIYELARCHCDSGPFVIGLEELQKLVGAQGVLSKFRLKMIELQDSDVIPGYEVEVRDVRRRGTNGRKTDHTEVILSSRTDGPRRSLLELKAA